MSLTSHGLSLKLKGSIGGLVLHTWLQRIKVQVCPEATSYSHIFCSKRVHSQNTPQACFPVPWEITTSCFSSMCHRFGFCLTLNLYSLFDTIIYSCTSCWMFSLSLFMQEQTFCQTYQVTCSDSRLSLLSLYLLLT